MEWLQNKCGGARFRTLPDHQIEVEGHGVPVLDPSSAEFRYLRQTWDNWQSLIRKHAKKTGMPPSYLLAVATKETGLWSGDPQKQATIGSPAGAQGIMQVMPCRIFERGRFKDLVCGREVGVFSASRQDDREGQARSPTVQPPPPSRVCHRLRLARAPRGPGNRGWV